MGKQPVRMKAVVYALSPFQQKIMPGLWKDLTGKIHHKVSDNWISTILLLGPLVGTYALRKDHGGWKAICKFANSVIGLWWVCPKLPGEGEVGTQVLKQADVPLFFQKLKAGVLASSWEGPSSAGLIPDGGRGITW
ncbi:hypothetical protein WN944_018212 [Citrus x changshan-huyou]|uniref:Cytochrome b-c1 complex subunit 8 n=1 Tax=Citrus x changshan-huyou TaxID=2935761 RepID=A0AAP0LTN0_9ROSI